jgi:hypothetical protein
MAILSKYNVTMIIDKETKLEIIHLFELGIGLNEVCDIVGVAVKDIHEAIESDRKIKAAKESGLKRTNLKVIEALLKTAIGYKIETTSTERRYAKDGMTVVSKCVTTTEKDVPANLGAIRIWLDNKDSAVWKDTIDDVEQKLNITVTVDGKTIAIKGKDNE